MAHQEWLITLITPVRVHVPTITFLFFLCVHVFDDDDIPYLVVCNITSQKNIHI